MTEHALFAENQAILTDWSDYGIGKANIGKTFISAVSAASEHFPIISTNDLDENPLTLVTAASDSLTLGKINAVKGYAMQKIFCKKLQIKREEMTIKKIYEAVRTHKWGLEKRFWLNMPFIIGNKKYHLEKEYIRQNELEQEFQLEHAIKIFRPKKDAFWKRCSNCGQFIPTHVKKARKCKKCKIGFFRIVYKKFDNVEKITFDSFEDFIKYGLEQKLLIEIKDLHLNRRIDAMIYSEGTLIIFECKNHEKTRLYFKEFAEILTYPEELKALGIAVHTLKIIFNGGIEDEIREILKRGYEEKVGVRIELVPFISLFPQGVEIFAKKRDGERKWHYSFVEGKRVGHHLNVQEQSYVDPVVL